jgi:hypothetical protein
VPALTPARPALALAAAQTARTSFNMRSSLADPNFG